MNRLVIVLSAAALAACGGARAPATARTLTTGDAGAVAAGPASEEDAAIPISADDATWGSRLAPVTIVAFEDFSVRSARRRQTTLSKVQAAYGAEKLRVVFKNLPLPFHPNARPAAEAAEGVRAHGRGRRVLALLCLGVRGAEGARARVVREVGDRPLGRTPT